MCIVHIVRSDCELLVFSELHYTSQSQIQNNSPKNNSEKQLIVEDGIDRIGGRIARIPMSRGPVRGNWLDGRWGAASRTLQNNHEHNYVRGTYLPRNDIF